MNSSEEEEKKENEALTKLDMALMFDEQQQKKCLNN